MKITAMTTIPDYMPVLSSGAHTNPSEGGCLMEYVSLLAGEPWSDNPACTHRALASAARRVNDYVSDESRHLLVPLIGRLFGTAPAGTAQERKTVALGLAAWAARRVGREQWGTTACPADIHWAGVTASAVSAVVQDYWGVADTTVAARDGALVAYLTGLLDEYDRLTGRTAHTELTAADLAYLAAATT